MVAGEPMHDVLYITLTIAFFALMLAYVRACELLGSVPDDGEDHE